MLGFGCCGAPHPLLVPEGHTELSREQLKQLYDLCLRLNGGKLLVHGIFARANTQNTNKRVYPKDAWTSALRHELLQHVSWFTFTRRGASRFAPQAILKREVKWYKARHIKAGTALGELDHPSYSSQLFKHLNLPNVSHQVLSVKWHGDELWGTIEVLPTPSGLLLWELYSKGIRLGVSSRGWASLVQDPKSRAMVVDQDFELITFDFVTEPSTQGAFLVPICRTYRKPVPQQSSVVQISHMGIGSVAMENVQHLPTPATLHARIHTLQKKLQTSQMAIKAAGNMAGQFRSLAAPTPAAASSNSAGLLQPLMQHQQPRPEAEGVLQLTSHYSTEQDAPVVQADPHGRNLSKHLSTFAMRAHLADDTGGCTTAHSGKGCDSRQSRDKRSGLAAGGSAPHDRLASGAAHSGVAAPAIRVSDLRAARTGSSKARMMAASGAAATAGAVFGHALSRNSDDSMSTSGSLRAATPGACAVEDGEHQQRRMPGCGLKAVLQSQQRIQPQELVADAHPAAAASSCRDHSSCAGQQAVQPQAAPAPPLRAPPLPPPPAPPPPPPRQPPAAQAPLSAPRAAPAPVPPAPPLPPPRLSPPPAAAAAPWLPPPGAPAAAPRAPPPAPAPPPPPHLLQQQQRRSQQAREQPQPAAQQRAPSAQDEQSYRIPGSCSPLSSSPQPAAATRAAPDQWPVPGDGCRLAGVAPPSKQQQLSASRACQPVTQPPLLSNTPTLMSAFAQASDTRSLDGLPACVQQHRVAHLASRTANEACAVAVPVAAGCTAASSAPGHPHADALSCYHPEIIDYEDTLINYKAKCFAAQQAVNDTLSSQAFLE